jgi:dolichyl-phosphate-mannose-protein mannosyltransferase/tetratricopeptide repeat protein
VPKGQTGQTRTPGAQPRPASSLALRLLPVLPLVLAVLVHRRAFDSFFGTDDFMRLEQAVGLLPATPTLWRLVSEVLYVKLMLGLFGPQPLPFHIVSMALHVLNTAFVYRMGRRAGLSAGASCFAASAFGAFPIFYTVLLSAVNINDILSLTFLFLAVLALETPTVLRGAVAVACFAIAFLSKEAILFVPYAALLLTSRKESAGSTARRLLPLLVASVLFTALYLMFRTHGIGTGGQAYTMGIGVHLVHNLMTYSWWSVDLVRAVPDAVGQFDTSAWRVGMWPLVAFAVAALLSRSRARSILFGCAWWLLGLLPVLPLTQHTYGHYLYVPMAGFVIASAGVLEAIADAIASARARSSGVDATAPRAGKAGAQTAPRPARPAAQARRAVLKSRIAVGAFALLGIAFAFRSEQLLALRSTARLGKTEFALDPFTRKMDVARAAVATLRGQLDRDHDTVVVFTPPGLGKGISSRTGREVETIPSGAPSYDVTEAVLDGGRALRLFEPRLDSVVFARRWTPDYRELTLFTESPGGRLLWLGRGPGSHSHFAALMIRSGFFAPAREYLDEVITAYPDDRVIQLLYAIALSRTGAPDSARARAQRLVEGAPPDTIVATARKLIAEIDAKK